MTNDTTDDTDTNPHVPTHERLAALEAQTQTVDSWVGDLDARLSDLQRRVETHHHHPPDHPNLADAPHACPECGGTAYSEPLAGRAFGDMLAVSQALVITQDGTPALGLHFRCRESDCGWTFDGILPFQAVNDDD